MSNPLVDLVLRMREGGAVRRCHAVPHHGHYDVAQHSFGMLLLLSALHPNPPKSLYEYILRHDLHERWLGDIPCETKIFVPGLREGLRKAERHLSGLTKIDVPIVTGRDALWVKALDWLEFLLWCDEQIGLGYRALIPKRITVWKGLEEMDLPEEVRDFLKVYRWRRTEDNPS